MAIYNLGMLEQPKEETNPYVGMLMQYGLQSDLQQQEIAGRKELATAQGEAEAKTFLARRALEQTDATRKNLTATWQSLSDKPDNERKLFVETDHGKEYLKTVKKYIPELFDDNSNPIFFPSTKDQVKQQVDSAIADAKNTLITKGPNALSEGQRGALQMEGYRDEIAQTTADLYRNPEFMFLLEEDPKKAQDMAQRAVQQRINMRKSMEETGGVRLNDLSSSLGGQPNATPISQEATPQRTRFKVKRLP